MDNMTWSGPLEKIDDYRYKIPQTYRNDMSVDAVIYANNRILSTFRNDSSAEQLVNVSSLPGILKNAMAMPDVHQGYGFPIGGVAGVDYEEGAVSPGGVGYDINCGVRLLRTDLTVKDVQNNMKDLVNSLFSNVPSGVGSSGKIKVSASEIENVLGNGAQWAVENGYGWEKDLENLEENGRMDIAAPENVSSRAIQRGRSQLGSLGAGNHFLEIQVVDEILRPQEAERFGITAPGQIVVMIHTGSRGLGYQVCDDYIKELSRNYRAEGKRYVSREFGYDLPDRELVAAPINSPKGQRYLGAMAAAANFAWANRQMIVHWVRQSFKEVMRMDAEDMGMEIVYDVAHNIAKIEEHRVSGKRHKVLVHRKGATRSFGPGRTEIPAKYRELGQPVLIPGDMGTESYLLVGTGRAMEDTFGSTCHGAGRVMSRREANRRFDGGELIDRLRQRAIIVKAATKKIVAQEAPDAYKDVSAVVETTEGAGISLRVARFRPLGVVKG